MFALDQTEEVIFKIFDFQYSMGTDIGTVWADLMLLEDQNRALWIPAELGMAPLAPGQ